MTILLLRHARAAFPDPGMSDFERPLTLDGVEAAHAVAKYLKKNDLSPDTVFCSPAVRTCQTLAALEQGGVVDSRNVIFEPELYGGDLSAYFELVSQKAYGAVIMIVGHNPMIEDLAFNLCSQSENSEAMRIIEAGYPAAGLANIKLNVEWEDIAPGTGTLIDFKKP